MMGSDAHQVPVSNANMSQGELLSRINAALGKPLPPSPKSVHVNKDISALAGRGMNLPVKHKHESSRKRPRSESPEATDSVVGSQADDEAAPPAQPPAKRAKLTLKGPRDPSLSLLKAASPPQERSRAEKKSKVTKKKAPVAANSKKSRKPAVQQSSVPGDVEAVVAGTRLPDNQDQAKQAAKLRHDRLLAQHRALQVDAKRRRGAQREPDMMPEFFNVANFTPGLEEDSVRCVCGVTVDDGGNMVGCDDCLVWQHNQCMGEGVPKDLKKTKYECHQCDPWAHRKLIARMREERPMGGQ